MKTMNFIILFLVSVLLVSTILDADSQLYTTQKLLPIDDAYVTIDYNDPDDLNQFQSINTGELYFLKFWNIYNVTGYTNNLETIIFLKFDLTNIDPQNIQDSRLMLYPFLIDLENPEDIELFFMPENQWDESTITYLASPTLDSQVITVSEITLDSRWYSWDITKIIKENTGSQVSLALKLKEKSSNQEKIISFYSKENSDKSTIPHLEINYVDSSETTHTQVENYSVYALIISIIALAISIISIKVRKS